MSCLENECFNDLSLSNLSLEPLLLSVGDQDFSVSSSSLGVTPQDARMLDLSVFARKAVPKGQVNQPGIHYYYN